jgi:hypothetical protein
MGKEKSWQFVSFWRKLEHRNNILTRLSEANTIYGKYLHSQDKRKIFLSVVFLFIFWNLSVSDARGTTYFSIVHKYFCPDFKSVLFEHFDFLSTGWPDEFVKNRPKCSPTAFLSKIVHNFYCVKKSHKNSVIKNCPKKIIPRYAKNRQFWSGVCRTQNPKIGVYLQMSQGYFLFFDY